MRYVRFVKKIFRISSSKYTLIHYANFFYFFIECSNLIKKNIFCDSLIINRILFPTPIEIKILVLNYYKHISIHSRLFFLSNSF